MFYVRMPKSAKVEKMKFSSLKNIYSDENLSKIAGAYNNQKIRKLFIFFIVVFCVVFSIVFLYQPSRDLYVSIRENDRLQAQYEAIKNTNDKLTEDIEALKTEEGVKQKAIETLGLIQSGESIGYVAGTEFQDGRDNSANSTSSKLAYKNIKTPKTWYSPFFDFIFNFHE